MHSRTRFRFAIPVVLIALVAAGLVSQGEARSPRRATTGTAQVVVTRGHRVQIAFVGSSDFPAFTHDFRKAIEMAIEEHPTVRGFPIQVDESDPPCFSGADPKAANIAVATAIVDSRQNTSVIGHVCSDGLRAALPVYERAGVVTISGSASASFLPGTLGPTVFNRTIVVSDEVGDAGHLWIAQVSELPSDLAFQEDFQAEFGSTPMPYSDLYFDAASLLLRRLRQTSRLAGDGNLVIDRARLARAVRATRYFQGVSCRVTLDAFGNRVNDPDALSHCAEE